MTEELKEIAKEKGIEELKIEQSWTRRNSSASAGKGSIFGPTPADAIGSTSSTNIFGGRIPLVASLGSTGKGSIFGCTSGAVPALGRGMFGGSAGSGSVMWNTTSGALGSRMSGVPSTTMGDGGLFSGIIPSTSLLGPSGTSGTSFTTLGRGTGGLGGGTTTTSNAFGAIGDTTLGGRGGHINK